MSFLKQHSKLAQKKDADLAALRTKERAHRFARFKSFMGRNFFLRIHMSIIIAAVAGGGILFNRFLYFLDIKWMVLRYPLTVLVSYLLFLGLVRVWLSYLASWFRQRQQTSAAQASSSVLDNVSGIPLEIPSFSPANVFSGGGGSSGGGGASASWSNGIGQDSMGANITAPAETSSSSSGISFDADVGEGFWVVVLIILFIAIVCAIFGASIYLVWQAPEIVAEAAFQFMLGPSLLKASKEISQADWVGSILKRTAAPFLVILLLSAGLGWAAHKVDPHATRLIDVASAVEAVIYEHEESHPIGN